MAPVTSIKPTEALEQALEEKLKAEEVVVPFSPLKPDERPAPKLLHLDFDGKQFSRI